MKKIISSLLVCLILVSCFSISVSAKGTVVAAGKSQALTTNAASNNYHKQQAQNVLSKYVDINTLTTKILNAVSNGHETADISSYKIPESLFTYICDYVFYGIPEAFNVSEMNYYYYTNTGIMTDLIFYYKPWADTYSEYKTCKTKMDEGANQLLNGIKGNNNLGVVEKLLLLHDRLALWNTYDHEGLAENQKDNTKRTEIYTAYAALGERKAVCQGYAMAYMYLLNQIGVESYYCSSDDIRINHGWNIVFVNGKKYHVDVTWDDSDLSSEVSHANFLRSSLGMYETGHTVLDFDTSPNDTTYDNYFWQRTHAQFLLIDNVIYYMDNVDQQLKRYSDKKVLCTATWQGWSNNYSRITTDGRAIYYTLPTAVYRYDINAGTKQKVYSPSLSSNEVLIGVIYQNEKFYCAVGNTDNSNIRDITASYKYDYGFTSGDINDDAKINNRDLAVLMQYINGWKVTVNIDASDVNDDGKVNNRDYAVLMQYINGWSVQLG